MRFQSESVVFKSLQRGVDYFTILGLKPVITLSM